MKKRFAKLREKQKAIRSRIGDFWWYSLVLFCACRFADILNAFVGLWIVPKHVPSAELGALMPLAQFANFLAIPIAAFANTFRNELSRLSIGKEFGKLKTLMRSVFIASAIFIFIATLVAHFALPTFLERIRIAEGSLGIIIIATSFVTAVAPIYSNALQSLKKFRATAVINLATAPLRLVVMLVAMPFRAISGYFIGQASTPLLNIVGSVFALKRELSIKAAPYWNKNTIRKFTKLFAIFMAFGLIEGFFALVDSTVLRQRLPDLDSAGFYMASRFSEIANYLSTTLMFAIFPYTAEKAARGENILPLVTKSLIINAAFCTFLALFFILFGKDILSVLPHGKIYSAYWWVIPWMIGIAYTTSIISIYLTAEFSANSFTFLKWYLPMDFACPMLLLLVTGHGYLSDIIPSSWTDFLSSHNIYNLETMLWWMTIINTFRAVICVVILKKHQRKNTRRSKDFVYRFFRTCHPPSKR